MEENTKENMSMTRKKAKETSSGQMEECIKEDGRTENSMASESILATKNKPEEDFGKMVNVSNGLMTTRKLLMGIIETEIDEYPTCSMRS